MNWLFYLKTTETCNLNCKHCFTNGKNGAKVYWQPEKVADWVERFIDYHKPTEKDTIHCEFHGGEPFLVSPDEIQYVVDRLKDKAPNITFGATTNLVFKLRPEHIKLIKNSFQGRLGTSWDARVRFDNDKQYNLWLDNVELLVNEGIDIKLFMSLTKPTLEVEKTALLQWVKSLNVKELSFERITHDGRANLFPDIIPTNTELDNWFMEMHNVSEELGARYWFENEFLEIIYDKFEKNFIHAGTFCRDCEEKLFTLNATGTIAGCPNSAPEQHFGHIDDSIETLINRPIRINNIACERARNPNCYSCEVFSYCGGDCHQLAWDGDICGAPKTLMKHLAKNNKRIPIFEVR